MKKISFPNPFTASGQWLKGNLHAHTTNSDGRVSPETSVKKYIMAAYDFLAITDHNKRTLLPDSGLLLIPGEEIDFGFRGHTFHMAVFGTDKLIGLSHEKRKRIHPRKIIQEVRARGGEAVLAHPYWSNETIKATEMCAGILGVEVYNHGCEVETGNGYSMTYWDDLLRLGFKTYGFAVDDSHGYQPLEYTPDDSCGGWVMVKAEERSVSGIMKALRNGLFYSSAGPEIKSITILNEKISVKTSSVHSITFRTPQWGGKRFERTDGTNITNAEFILKNGGIKCLRIECTDLQGKMAWANPIWIS